MANGSFQTRDLVIRRRRETPLQGVTMQAKAGEIVSIIGPSQSGKSVLLQALAGGLKYQGSITLNGRELRDIHPAELALHRSRKARATFILSAETAQFDRIG